MYLSVMHLCSKAWWGSSAFGSHWQHWTVKRSLCALTALTRGSICLCVSMTTLNSEEITLCSDSVVWGVHLPLSLIDNTEQWRDHSVLWQCQRGSICLWCLYLYICTGISLYFLISACESQWQHWTVKRSLCALTVLTRGGYLPLSLIDNIEQQRDRSVLFQCRMGGPSAFGVCIFIYALVFHYIFLYLPLSLNDNIEQWRDHSVLWQCWPSVEMWNCPSGPLDVSSNRKLPLLITRCQ